MKEQLANGLVEAVATMEGFEREGKEGEWVQLIVQQDESWAWISNGRKEDSAVRHHV
jgi:hypothetical protein